jgi:hypothetical protein
MWANLAFYSALTKAGRIADLDAFQPLSLDEIRMEDEECTLYRFIPEPEVPYRDPQQDAQKRAALEVWRAQLPPFAQQVLRLSFGLCEEDGRAQTPGEIATSLGVTAGNISFLKRCALLKLKAIAEGRARERRQRAGAPARLAQVSFPTADKFLRRREHPAGGALQPCARRLEAAYAHLQATGKCITAYALSKQADVHVKTAERFLEREGMLPGQDPQARCAERLEQAHAQMQAEGTPITITTLAHRAGVHYRTAQRFFEVHQPEQALWRTGRDDPEKSDFQMEKSWSPLSLSKTCTTAGMGLPQ